MSILCILGHHYGAVKDSETKAVVGWICRACKKQVWL